MSTTAPRSASPFPNSTRPTRGSLSRLLAENLLRHARACRERYSRARVRTTRLPHAPRSHPRERAHVHQQAARTPSAGDRGDRPRKRCRRKVVWRRTRVRLHVPDRARLADRRSHRARAAPLGVGPGRPRPHGPRRRDHGLRRLQAPRPSRSHAIDQLGEGDHSVGETASARTERELAELRGQINADLDYLIARIRDDADPRNLARRQPIAVFGTLGSVAAIVGVALASRVKSFRRSRTETELDQVIERLGGRLDRLKGRARKRFRETLKKEIEEVETGPRAKQMIWESAAAALTAAATLFARRFVSRLTGDKELPDSEA